MDVDQKLTIATMCDNIIDNEKRNLAFQKAFTDTKYSGKEPLTCFVEDFRIETLTREIWNALLFIKAISNVINILDNHTVISEKEMICIKLKTTTKMYNTEKDAWFLGG